MNKIFRIQTRGTAEEATKLCLIKDRRTNDKIYFETDKKGTPREIIIAFIKYMRENTAEGQYNEKTYKWLMAEAAKKRSNFYYRFEVLEEDIYTPNETRAKYMSMKEHTEETKIAMKYIDEKIEKFYKNI